MSDLHQNVSAGVNRGHINPGGEKGPDVKSSDHNLMAPLWKKIEAFAGGVAGMRRQCNDFLPKLDLEEQADYDVRVKASPFTNIYEDISHNLASKPFSREVKFEDEDEVDEVYQEFYENVDGCGNNLHVFASSTFREGMDNGIDWILIDYTKLPPLPEGRTARSIDEEKRLGARPYWVRIAGSRVLAVYSAMVRGKEMLTYVRISEPTSIREGYDEVTKERVRIFEREAFTAEDGQEDYRPAKWRVEEKQKNSEGKDIWVVIDNGDVQIDIIPMIPFRTGKRTGNGWAVKAPLANLADMQVDAYQQESNLRNIELLVCYPMLTASGVEPPLQAAPGEGPPQQLRVRVGPRAVLWAPPVPGGGQPGSWKFIEPSAESIKVLQGELDRTWSNMREIGMQPLAESNLTVITSANVSVKAQSALQAWTLLLKDALEQAFVITAKWMNREDAPGVDVYKDFGVDLQSGKELDTIAKAADSGKLSGETLRSEMKRRNVLSESFDEEEEKERLANEAAEGAEGLEGEEMIDPVTGEPLLADNDDEVLPEGEEAVDAGTFENSNDIDDDTLAALFGEDLLAEAV